MMPDRSLENWVPVLLRFTFIALPSGTSAAANRVRQKRLEQADFVVRKRNPEDERQVVVSLTARGTRLREKARCLGETLFAAAGMTPKRLIDLNREVRAFRDSVADFLEKNPAADC